MALLPGIFKPQLETTLGFKEWLKQGRWSPDAISKRNLTLLLHDTYELSDALINDGIQFSNAAFETCVVGTSIDLPDDAASAWTVICNYYSAYYAANALMRFSGFFCVNFDQQMCAAANEQALAYDVGGSSPSNQLLAASYFCVFDKANAVMTCRSMARVGGGVHAQFWHAFGQFLGVLKADLPAMTILPLQRQAALIEISNLVDSLNRNNCQNSTWMSECRNAVNYRFEHGAWFPYKGSVGSKAAVVSQLKSSLTGAAGLPKPADRLDDLQRSARLSGFLLFWLLDLIKIMGQTAKGGKLRSVDSGVLRFATLC
jgi:hypothetical protein